MWDVNERKLLPESMLEQICEQEGGVVLMHDIHANTVNNIEAWIQAIRAEGHEIVGLEEFVPRLKADNTPANQPPSATSDQGDH